MRRGVHALTGLAGVHGEKGGQLLPSDVARRPVLLPLHVRVHPEKRAVPAC